MIIDMGDFAIDLDILRDAFVKLLKDMGLDETNDQQVYHTITLIIASLIASGLRAEYDDDVLKLEEKIQTVINTIAEDLEIKIKALLVK